MDAHDALVLQANKSRPDPEASVFLCSTSHICNLHEHCCRSTGSIRAFVFNKRRCVPENSVSELEGGQVGDTRIGVAICSDDGGSIADDATGITGNRVGNAVPACKGLELKSDFYVERELVRLARTDMCLSIRKPANFRRAPFKFGGNKTRILAFRAILLHQPHCDGLRDLGLLRQVVVKSLARGGVFGLPANSLPW